VTWLQKLRYDLTDCAFWEFMFPSNDKRRPRDASGQNGAEEDDDVEAEFEVGLIVSCLIGSTRNQKQTFTG